MPLRIITGRAGTGKTTACLAEMKQCPTVLIVPEQYSFHMGKELLEDAPVTGFDGTQVYSFRRLASLLEGEVAGRVREMMSGGEKSILLSYLLLKNKDRFGVVKPRLSSVGEMSELIAELKKYRVEPDRLREVGDRLPDSLLKRKIEDVLLLYEEYESFPKTDTEDRFALLAANAEQSETVMEREIYIDQFTGFLPQEICVIRALLRTAPRVTVILTMDEGDEAPFETVQKTKRDLISMAKEVGEAVEEVHFSERFGAEEHPALAFLEREFFHYPHESFREEPKEIALYEAKTPLSEITHVAAGITRLLREGYRYSDMVVMGRNVDAYRTEIMAEFERFGIPYFLDRKLPLIRHRAGTALLSAVSALCHNWDSERIMRYLKCGYSDLEKDAIDRLENYVLATGIRGQAWYREEAWDMPLDTYAADDYPRENEGDLQNEMDRARRIAAEPLLRLYEGLKGERTLKEDTEAVVAFLEEIRFAEKLEQEAGAGGRAGEEDAQIYEEMMAVLRALCRSLGDVKVRPDDFYSMLEVGLSKRAIGAIPHSLDHVQISDIARAKGMGAKVVFLIGTEDGVFPQTISKQGFFNDHNRAVLAESGILLAPDSRHRAYMEQNLVYAALTAASDRLYVSYALTDAAGEEQFPSRIIERLRQLFPLLTTQNDRGGMPQEDRILTAKGTFLPMLEHLRLCRAGMEEEFPEYRAAFRWYEEQDEWREKIEAARKTEEEDLSPKNLSSETAGKLYGTHLSASISRLETYRKCPFRYFAQYGLALKERKEYGLNPMDTGSFLHRIMEEFSRTLAFHQTAWKDLTDEELLRNLDDVMPGILAHCSAYLMKESPRMANRFLRLKKTAKTSLEIMRSHFQKGAFEPLGYELTFAEGGDLDPICIALPEGSVSLRGKIDRADRVETEDGVFYRVVDYKSGNKEFDLSEVYHGLSIQLMVYMDTLLENRQKAGEKALPAAAVYYRLTDPVIRAMPQSGEEEIRAQIEEKMKLEGMIVTEQAAMAAMDQCPAGGKSTVAAIKQNANGTYRGTSVYKSVTLEQYERLREHVREIIREIAADMMSGTIEAKPYRDKKIHPCGSCSYRAVCGFDDQIECYRYDENAHLSGKKVWERLEGES